ncbi:competence protein CoiA family protein [Exiguobacterium sp. SL14]|nr:competence protein CoiA family protein [Exiguobacterium sp. SL14]MCY1690471.1 competence protein CoiA family protein [Exiguobacterium sp. SL14]
MFEAIDDSGKRIMIHRFSIRDLKAMSLRCPYCLKPLRVRQGRRLHFAHISACSGESGLHISWKQRIADSLMTAGIQVETEWTTGQRRFDLWLPDKQLGIEIQRSPMSADEWIRRAKLDAKQKQTVRWIGFHPSQGVTIRLQGWMRQAFLQNDYLDLIVENQIRRFRHPVPFAKHHVYCTVQSLSLSDFLSTELPSFPQIFNGSMARNRSPLSSATLSYLFTSAHSKTSTLSGRFSSTEPTICCLSAHHPLVIYSSPSF